MNQISPLAYVHPEAKLGDNNVIGPFCYIDRDTVIGDNARHGVSAVFEGGARFCLHTAVEGIEHAVGDDDFAEDAVMLLRNDLDDGQFVGDVHAHASIAARYA